MDRFLHRVYNPILPYPGIRIEIQFADIVIAGGAGGNDFYDPVGRSGTSPVSQLVRVSDYAYVRFDYKFVVVCEQLDSKRGGVDFAVPFF